MNKKEAYAAGYDRGWNAASWTDLPEIGDSLSRDVDWQGIGTIESVSDQIDAWRMLASAAESHGRDFSPFEVIAHELNESREPEEYWDSFDCGIAAGIEAYRRKHYPLAYLRKRARA